MFDAFTLGDDFSVLGALVLVDGFSLVVVFGFGEVFPFAEDVVPLVDGVVFVEGVFVPLRSFATDAETVDESADLGAVSGFTAGAHAQAMTIANSGIRA